MRCALPSAKHSPTSNISGIEANVFGKKKMDNGFITCEHPGGISLAAFKGAAERRISMLHIQFYTKENCSLCEEAKELLSLLQDTYSFELEERDIYTNDAWLEAYQIRIPVVDINGEQLDANEINYASLERMLKRHLKA